ncbi:MAG: hypothetical protein IJ692_03260 [Alloprevotella sp.]|nr:hypothetical protein [Alloprevotella sp.]
MEQQQRIGVGQYLKNAMKQGLQVFKNPLKLLPTIVIGAVWIVLGYLSAKMQPFPMPLKIASFLSYAEGGLFGGVLGAVGGIAGKVVMAVFINSAILPLFEKKLPFVGVAGGIKGMFTSMSKDTARGIAPLLKGLGFALLVYVFFNINQGRQNSIVGVVALVLLLQNIGNQGGFLFGLLFSLANSMSKGRVPRYINITRFLTGMTLGFTLAVGLSAIGFHWCLWLGLLFLVLGFFFGLIIREKKTPQAPAVPMPGQPVPPQPMQAPQPAYGAPPAPNMRR